MSIDDAPVPDLAVSLVDPLGERVAQTRTDALGEFRLNVATGVHDGADTPRQFALHSPYPNPFNPETTIPFDLPSSADVDLSLYNLAGQQVATLASGLREAGSYNLVWDGRDDAGRDLASGMYFYRLIAGDRVKTRKLMLLR